MTAVGIINVIERVDQDKDSRNMSQRHKVTSVRHFGQLFPVNGIIRHHSAVARQHCVVRLQRTNNEWNPDVKGKQHQNTAPPPPKNEVMQITSFQSSSLCA